MEENEEGRVKNEEEEEEQQVWSWGAGTDGQLGTGRLQDDLLPQLLRLPSLSAVGPISLLACGGAHVLALTSGGKVLTWGRGTSGQLGHSDRVNSPHPKLVMSLDTYFITHASAGWNHSGFVSDAGDVFTCGDGSFGQLGHGDYSLHCSPVKVSFFDDHCVEQIACGMRHSLVLLKGNSGDEVYGFGSGKRGQLGISKDKIKSISLPERIYGLEAVKVTSIIANGDQSAALSADGHMYTWGKGFGGTSSAHSPQSLPKSLWFTKAAVGWNHALLLTAGGEVFMLGGNHHGVLGNPDKMTPARLLADSGEAILDKVPGLEENRIMDIAAGAEHSVIVTDDGEIKTWGWGEHGQLGLGNTCDQTTPQEVSLGHKSRKEAAAIKIYCGSGFTMAVRTPHLPSQTD
ncbi:ultraviolet-B receptor UVR8 isoform X1 [Rosa chinensis]|uniref:ultraviolet-B receptor UVR8 isoform X1 n=1 Tax=Rosa chinensis TaxID=74649 RepID=UPI000D089664|nr:ultraviolet-B receptor UVR8 isoform X1 [Rosa chinensis]